MPIPIQHSISRCWLRITNGSTHFMAVHWAIIRELLMATPLDLNRTAAVPPFQAGDLIRPHTPHHPWRAHRILVKTCHQDQNAGWVVVVRVYMGSALTTTVMAGDFEKVTVNG